MDRCITPDTAARLNIKNISLTTHNYALACGARNRSRKTLNSGSKIRMIATTVIGPAIGRVKKIDQSPSDNSNDCLSLGSAIGPYTIASTAGASG